MIGTDDVVHLKFISNCSREINRQGPGWHSLASEDIMLQRVNNFFKIYYSMILVIAGTVFNGLSIAVLQRAAFKRTSTSVFLQYLAVIDTLVLYSGIYPHFIEGVSGYNIKQMDEQLCRFNMWLMSLGPDASVWTLVAVTIERVIAIAWPHKIKIVCTKATARLTVTFACVLAICSNFPLFIFYGDIQIIDKAANVTITRRCVVPQPQYAAFDMWYWLDSTKFVLLPGTILISSSIIIVYLVIRSRQRLHMVYIKHSKNDVTKITATSHVDNKTRLQTNTYDMKAKHHMSISRKDISVTITLVVINSVFLVCNVPVSVCFLGSDDWFHCDGCPAHRLLITVALMVMYTSNAINFLLYCATVSKFRDELHLMFVSMFKV